MIFFNNSLSISNSNFSRIQRRVQSRVQRRVQSRVDLGEVEIDLDLGGEIDLGEVEIDLDLGEVPGEK